MICSSSDSIRWIDGRGAECYVEVWGSKECRLCRRINVTHQPEVAFASAARSHLRMRDKRH